MGRKKSKKFQQPEGEEGDAKDNTEGEKHAEPVGAVLAVHPNIDAVAIAVGTQLRVLDRRHVKSKVYASNNNMHELAGF